MKLAEVGQAPKDLDPTGTWTARCSLQQILETYMKKRGLSESTLAVPRLVNWI